MQCRLLCACRGYTAAAASESLIMARGNICYSNSTWCPCFTCSLGFIEHLNPCCLLQEAAILGTLSFVMALVVLLFFSSVLLNIVDAVFMCYALDLDTQSVTKSEVHEVFSQVRHHQSLFDCILH